VYPTLSWREKFQVYDPTPTAWDFASSRAGPGFVRVLTKDGVWVGGYAGPQSFFTSYPEPREIFIEQAWVLDDQGTFESSVQGTAGLWIRCDDALIVQFLLPQQDATESADNGNDDVDATRRSSQ
jgi:hypothetical protein